MSGEPTAGEGSYYVVREDGSYQPTGHVQGAWNDHEQHMGPVSGLIVHAIDQHEPRDLHLGRVTFDILGVIPAEPTTVEVATIRPGRTIELVEATLVVQGRPRVRARAWRLAYHDTAAVEGGVGEPLPAPDIWPVWEGTRTWAGGYIGSVEGRRATTNEPGHGQVWIRTAVRLIEGVDVSPTAAFVGLVDTANGIVVRQDPATWMFPNVDLSIHLFREPAGGPGAWVGFDTNVAFADDGIGLTTSTLYDSRGPVGRSEQLLTVRRLS